MLHRGGEAEGPDRRTPAERPPRRRDPGEDKVPAHPAQSPADAQRLLQVFPGHPAPVSGGGGRRGSAVLLTLAANIDSQGHSKPHVNDGALTWSACKGRNFKKINGTLTRCDFFLMPQDGESAGSSGEDEEERCSAAILRDVSVSRSQVFSECECGL